MVDPVVDHACHQWVHGKRGSHQIADARMIVGGFRREPGQLSADHAGYREEMLQLADRAGPLDWLAMLADRLAWYLPPAAKKFLNPDRLHLYDHQAARWT